MKIRLYIPHPFTEGASLPLSAEQTHYLTQVMRLKEKESVFVFNGEQGEWEASLSFTEEASAASKNDRKKKSAPSLGLCLLRQSSTHRPPADIWLCFALLKKAPLEYLVQKTVELGVGVLKPMTTQYTQPQPFKKDRLDMIAVEAAEQCRLTAVPLIEEPTSLKDLLKAWPEGRHLLFCDERMALTGENPLTTLQKFSRGEPWGIVLGPEGGFSPQEQTLLREHPASVPINLGPRIMRAETAAVSALTLWQACLGDWE